MKRLILICLATLAMPGLLLAEAPRIDNPAQPANGVQQLQLTELWRAGGLDEEVIFGVISDVKTDAGGRVYVLDSQLCEVKVLSPEGELLDFLSREGDGPGELRQPTEMMWLPGDVLGVVMGFPGKIVCLGLDGTPGGEVHPASDPADGGFCFIRDAAFAGDMLVACAGKMSFDDGNGESWNERYLAVCDADGSNRSRVLESKIQLNIAQQKYIEADDYYVNDRWAIGADGLIWAAAERDAYAISAYRRDGTHVKTVCRDYEPRRRNQAEKDVIGSDIRIVVDGEDLEIDRDVEDCDPCVSRVLCDEAGRLMVLPPQGHNDQPEGVLETWDVFDQDGTYSHQLVIPRAGDASDEATYFVGNGLFVIVKGENEFDPDEEEEVDDTEVLPLEVICYRID